MKNDNQNNWEASESPSDRRDSRIPAAQEFPGEYDNPSQDPDTFDVDDDLALDEEKSPMKKQENIIGPDEETPSDDGLNDTNEYPDRDHRHESKTPVADQQDDRERSDDDDVNRDSYRRESEYSSGSDRNEKSSLPDFSQE